MAKGTEPRETWGSNLGFILAATGSAVGLGNIWKFPYIAGENGGGAFVLIYLLCIAIIGLPVMLCEILLGRHTRRNPVGAFRALTPDSSTVAHLLGFMFCLSGVFLLAFQHWGWGLAILLIGAAVFRWSWRVVGGMGVLAGFVILSFYSIIAGWTIGYMVDAGTGKLAVADDATHAESEALMVDHMWARTSAAKTGLSAVDAELAGATVSGVPAEKLLQAWRESQTKPVDEKQWLAIVEKPSKITPFRLEEPLEVADIAVTDGIFRRGTATADDETSIDLTRAVPQGGVITRGRLLSGRVTDVAGGVVQQAALQDCTASGLNVSMNLPWWSLGFHTLFMLCVVGTVLLGVQRGIEMAAKILMPLLLLLLVALILRGVTLEGAGQGIQFFLSPDFGKLTTAGVLTALGHAFFSLSLGMGAMITYGSYVDREQNVFLSSLSIVVLDTVIALLAGLAIFPAVFAMGFAPDAGPALIFQLIPQVFARIPLGFAWCMVFFLLLSVAALTSGISLQEVVTAYFIDERGWSRKRATIVFGSVIWFLGCLSAVSFYGWGRLLWLKQVLQSVFGTVPASFFATMDNLASNWMLPLGGFFISLFVGWIWGTRKAVVEIRHGSENFADVHLVALLSGLKEDESHNSTDHVWTLASVWGIFIRFLSPLAILIAFLYTIGWLKL